MKRSEPLPQPYSRVLGRAPAQPAPAARPFAIRRYPLVLAAAVGLVGALLLLHISIGTVDVTPAQVVAVLAQHATTKLNALLGWHLALPQDWAVDKLTNTVVWDLRLPRAAI